MRSRIGPARLLVLAVALGLSTPLPASGQNRDDEVVIGSWEGRIEAGGNSLTLVFTVVRDASGGLTGTMESPDQSAMAVPLSSATFVDGRLTLVVSNVPGSPTFSGTPSEDGTTLSGTFSQGGGAIALELAKREVRAEP